MDVMSPRLTVTAVIFFFLNSATTTELYTLSLHDALPISLSSAGVPSATISPSCMIARRLQSRSASSRRSEEHTSELQSHSDLVCRLLLEKKQHDTPVVS